MYYIEINELIQTRFKKLNSTKELSLIVFVFTYQILLSLSMGVKF